jgi:hypothetical protein
MLISTPRRFGSLSNELDFVTVIFSCELEHSTPADITAGGNVLLQTALALAV